MRDLISTIVLSTNLILKHSQKISKEEQVQLLDSIQHSSDSLLELVNDLIRLPEIEVYDLDLTIDTHDYADIVENAVEDLKIAGKSKDLELNLAVEEIHCLEFDRKRINQVLQTLISTAMTLAREKSNLVVRVEKEDKYILTRVLIEGEPIPEEQVNLLLSGLEVKSKTEGCEESSIIDLNILKRIIEAHSGNFALKSDEGRVKLVFALPISINECEEKT